MVTASSETCIEGLVPTDAKIDRQRNPSAENELEIGEGSTPEGQSPPYTPPQENLLHPTCTCPRRREPVNQTETATTSPPDGTDWKKVAKVVGGVALVGAAVPTLAVAGVAAALPVIGFGTGGVIGGSIAAGIQSTLYGAFTGGLFSVFQSAGATIVAPAALEVVAAAGAATIGGRMIGAAAEEESEERERDVNGRTDTRVDCACAQCVCDAFCACACRKWQRRRLDEETLRT
ncbi:hypothetical protein DICSQDRAFT_151729 [Dichomitus squalens LYAD-421 SS1]|nr:uncharacterized protein DICSQDRAFT_151729 [Dichomitus squalens LYAD-421 SS1]EJF67506.1 hypothetical protein DICSQDRAFT_151729 [Dichomitus squalens LYAD-421 SS1]